jgi:hypothetical protein
MTRRLLSQSLRIRLYHRRRPRLPLPRRKRTTMQRRPLLLRLPIHRIWRAESQRLETSLLELLAKILVPQEIKKQVTLQPPLQQQIKMLL